MNAMPADSDLAALTPSGFMRKHRPELYSDTVDRPAYLLERSALEFQLETLTARNEHQRFEIFCRKLCERVICPQIRPQSGPEGGGDGKTDADTYPVSEAISDVRYYGQPGPGDEIWAFAFSAMKDWKRKVARDVEGIAGTGRAYGRVYFVTNQAARAKDRAKIEEELVAAHGLPVTILDRAWIANEVIDNERKDIAHDYLGVGQVVSDPMRMGPEDYSRRRRLNEVEKSLGGVANYLGMERQMVSEAMVAAQLSRNLECPRHETEGRHARAIRLARKHGTPRQLLEARHDALWTAFWWFDDADAVNDGYAEIEKEALLADHARNIEFLVQLHQLLVNAVIYRMCSEEVTEFTARSDRLEAALVKMTGDIERPNHRLEARTSLATVRLGRYCVEGRQDRYPEIWSELGSILDDAGGLAEFDADRLIRLIEVAAVPAGRDPTYRVVAERLADFVANRSSEAEGALILLRHAHRLEDDEGFERIRLLGKAARRLAKREHSDRLIEAQQHLAIAYRGADLLWAARASIIFAVAGISAEKEETGELPAGFVPTVKIWAWIALQLRLVPEFVLAMQLLALGLATIPLDEASKLRMAESAQELDAAFGSNILNMSDAELAMLSRLPDVLEPAGLGMSRIALLHALGYDDLLRGEGSLPPEESDETVNSFLSILKAQPVSSQLVGELILHNRISGCLETCIAGLTIKIASDGSDQSVMLAQAIVGTFEAVLATILEENASPHTEEFRVDIVECDDPAPHIATDPSAMRAMLSWPRTLSPRSIGKHDEVGRCFIQLVSEALAAAFWLPDLKSTIEHLFDGGSAHDRVSTILASLNSIPRITGKDVVRLDLEGTVDYPPRDRPGLDEVVLTRGEADDDTPPPPAREDGRPKIARHRGMKVQSVIDVHSWDRAKWTGILYASYGSDIPPVLALTFRNEAAAKQIFERWRERFGAKDINHAIYLSVIRGLPGHPSSNYAVQITSGRPEGDEWDSNTLHQVMNRVHVMEPPDNRNLEMFIGMHRTARCYLLAPAVLANGKTEIITDLAILKRDFTVVQATQIAEHDIENVALQLAMRWHDRE